MKAVIKAEYLKELINITYACSNEIRLNISKKKLSFSVVDIANVMLIHMDIKPSVFETKEIGESFEACIDVAKIRSFMGVFKGFINLEIDESNIVLSNLKYKYSAALLKSEGVKKSPNVPDIEFKSKCIVKVSDFRMFLRAYKKEFDKIYMGVDNVFFEARNGKSELNKLIYTESVGVSQESAISCFSAEYIIDAFSTLNGDVEVELGTNRPCKISFDALGGYAKGFFMVAPIWRKSKYAL